MFNKLAVFSAGVLLIIVSGIFTAPARAVEFPATRTVAPPVIDGVLDEACWQGAPIRGFTILDADRPSPMETCVWFAWDDHNLYIAMKCFTPDPNDASVRAPKVERDGRVMGYDSVEIMIDVNRDADTYIHLASNSSGSQFDRRVVQSGWIGENHWDGEWRTASQIGTNHYTVEMAIPFFNLGISKKTTSTWNINVCRNVRPPGVYTSLAPGGAYNVPTKFPSLTGINADFSRYMLAVGPVRTSLQFVEKNTHVTVSVDVANQAATTNNVQAENWLVAPDGKVHVKTADRVALAAGAADAAGGKATLSFGPYVLDKSGTYANKVVLMDPATKRPILISMASVQIECVPIALRIVEPSYRNTIFASQNLKKVVLEVEVGLDEAARAGSSLEIAVTAPKGDKTFFERSVKGLSAVNRLEFEAAALPAEGRFPVRVVLKDNAGRELARTGQTLLKLPYKKGEVWVGRDRVFRRDGKPIFPNGGWGIMTPARNFLLYGIFRERIVKAPEPGKLKVWIVDSGADRSELQGAKPLSEVFIEDVRERIRFYRDDSDILAWVMPDEPDCANYPPEKLRKMYEVIREEDPYHPVWISNNSVEGVKNYANCADAAVPHPYPPAVPGIPIGDFSVLLHVQRAYLEHTGFIKPIGFMHQGFNYGEFVQGRRMPSYYELRNQNVLALAAGATFLMGFESSGQHTWNPEVRPGLDYLTEEMTVLGSLVVLPTSTRKVACADKDVITLLKEHDGHFHLFVSNAKNASRRLSVSVDGLGSRRMQVISEGRSVTPTDGTITDSFQDWESHVYTTSSETSVLKTVQEISALIEAEYARRHKPGNIAFQRWDGQSVEISFSSRKGEYPPFPWHVCDGLTNFLGESHGFGLHTWCDGTPDKSPDWIALKFKKPHRVNRVVVSTVGKCLKDYTIQAWQGTTWVDVAQGKNNEAERIEHAFPATLTDQVRLYVTANHGPHVMISEIEVYAEQD